MDVAHPSVLEIISKMVLILHCTAEISGKHHILANNGNEKAIDKDNMQHAVSIWIALGYYIIYHVIIQEYRSNSTLFPSFCLVLLSSFWFSLLKDFWLYIILTFNSEQSHCLVKELPDSLLS